jgi:flavin-dependent dehydrogenase
VSPLAGHLTDLFVVERTMVSSSKRAFVVTSNQSCLHGSIGEANWDTRNRRRLDLLQRPSCTQLCDDLGKRGGAMAGLHLADGNRICIVGGGPAGCFAALHLLWLARQQGRRLEVLIFEPRNFTQPGPVACNRCAGILSSRLIRGMEQLGLSLPTEVIQAEVRAYAACVDNHMLQIERPDPRRQIVSVYRSGGPRLLVGEPLAGFDSYLLDQACDRGARHMPIRVSQITWEDRPILHTAQGDYVADLLVLATGVNSRPPLAPEFGYQPPKTMTMAQDEILRPPAWPDDQVRIFFKQPPGLLFGAFIPKGQYLSVSLLGQGLSKDTVHEFIEVRGPDVALTAGPVRLCGCRPRIAVSSARRYCGTRWVAVGDAAVTRLYKDGIGSAFFTAQAAMQVAVRYGISDRAFHKHYVPFCRGIAIDNFFGRMLFHMWSFVSRTPRMLRAWTTRVTQEADWPIKQRVHSRILWGMFSGDEMYRNLFWLALSPAAVIGLARGWQGARQGNHV